MRFKQGLHIRWPHESFALRSIGIPSDPQVRHSTVRGTDFSCGIEVLRNNELKIDLRLPSFEVAALVLPFRGVVGRAGECFDWDVGVALRRSGLAAVPRCVRDRFAYPDLDGEGDSR